MKRSLVLAIAVLSASLAALAAVQPAAGKAPAKVTVRKQAWRGYGYLPGYRPQVNNLDRRGRSVRYIQPEPRYLNLYTGQWNYGWGRPGFYRGRWNGGSFGPCWTQTPIGPMWNCGQ